jgi:ABC-type nitrate/sulfonate/bicarbonate transport system substrate-binding protein
MSATRRLPADPVQLWYSYCPVIHAGNVDDALGWARDELRKRGAKLGYFRSVAGVDYLPHYLHTLDNLFRFGGCATAIHVHADLRDTRLLGTQWVGEGGGMLARAGEGIYQVSDLRGRRVGISRSLNARKCDWWRATEERGIELMLTLNGLTREDVVLVDFPYADDWYDRPEMLAPVESASAEWLSRDHLNEMSCRPLEAALAAGLIDACYTTDPFVTARTLGRFKLIESLARYPDRTLQVANSPYTLTCTSELADTHPDLVVAYLKGLIRIGQFCNANRTAATTILDRNAFYPDVETAHRWIREVDFVPRLDASNLKALEVEKDWMLGHGYVTHDFDVNDWASPEYLEAARRELVEESFPTAASEPPARWQGGLVAAQMKVATPGAENVTPIRRDDDGHGPRPARPPSK